VWTDDAQQKAGIDADADADADGEWLWGLCLLEGVEVERDESSGWIDDVATDYAVDFLKKQQVKLLVDGRSVGRKKLAGLIGKMPNEGMQIGADTGSQVVEPAAGNFIGMLERVRV